MKVKMLMPFGAFPMILIFRFCTSPWGFGKQGGKLVSFSKSPYPTEIFTLI